jgi:hypothetical protein
VDAEAEIVVNVRIFIGVTQFMEIVFHANVTDMGHSLCNVTATMEVAFAVRIQAEDLVTNAVEVTPEFGHNVRYIISICLYIFQPIQLIFD